MDFKDLRTKIKALIFAIFGLFIVIVLIRMLFTMIDVDATAPIVKFWFNTASHALVAPFQNIYPQWFFGINIENAAILSVVVLFFLSVLFVKLATFFIEEEPYKILVNLVDLLFKVAEFVLLFRFIFALTGGKFVNFGSFINNVSSFVYEPFAGILPAIQIGSPAYRLELSTLVAIVFVIIFDVVTENILKSLFEKEKPVYQEPQGTQIHQNFSNMPNPYTNQPQQPNITINVAQPGVTQRVERRTVTTVNPNRELPQPGRYEIVDRK